MITANNQPPAVSQPNLYDQSAGLVGAATDTLMGPAGTLTNVNSYLNPFYQQVIDTALGRMQTNFDSTINQIGDSAIASGAYGGTRHGVAEGIAAGEFNRNVGEMTANYSAQGFDRAADLAYRDTLGQAQLGNQLFNMGNILTDRTMQQGTMQQSLLQTILGQGSEMFSGYMENPYRIIDVMNALSSSDPRRNNMQMQATSTPGLFDYLSLAAGLPWGGGLT